jgi:hypothetical protein
MKANVRVPEQILHSGNQYIIPLFQRYYKWTRTIGSGSGGACTNWWTRDNKTIIFLGLVVSVADNHRRVWFHGTLLRECRRKYSAMLQNCDAKQALRRLKDLWLRFT